MALRLENEFVVSTSVEHTWSVLLDVERVASCLPGATVEPGEKDGTFTGSMRVKVGPMSISYTGVGRIESVDELARTAVFNLEGREVRGQGSASALLTSTLLPEGDHSTRVCVQTDLSLTGRPAQFGRGILQDVTASLLSDFAVCLSERMAEQDAAPQATASDAVTPTSARPDSLELTGLLGRVVRQRLARWSGISIVRRALSRLRGRR